MNEDLGWVWLERESSERIWCSHETRL